MLCKEDDLDYIEGVDTVEDILDKLRKKYKGDMTAEFFTLQSKWEKLAFQSGDTISIFLSGQGHCQSFE
jgi:hypothetical protein